MDGIETGFFCDGLGEHSLYAYVYTFYTLSSSSLFYQSTFINLHFDHLNINGVAGGGILLLTLRYFYAMIRVSLFMCRAYVVRILWNVR